MQRFPDVDTSYYTSNVAIGGASGGEFTLNVGNVGPVVRSLQFWSSENNRIVGMEASFTEPKDKFFLHGRKVGAECDRFYFADGEKITSLKLWKSDFKGGRLGALELKTDQDRTLKFGNPTGEAYEVDTGSGLLIALFGHSGKDIDCLGFAILRRIQKARLIDLEYPGLANIIIETKPKEIKSITYNNKEGTVDQTFTFAGSETVQSSSSWSISAGLEYGVQIEVEGSVPLVSSVKATSSLKLSVSSTYQRENQSTSEESFSFPITVPAGQRLQATATLKEGNISLQYKAKLVYTLDSGKTMEYDHTGTYSGVSADQVVVTIDQF